MKTPKIILSLLVILCSLAAPALTPFYYSGVNSDGTPNTNTVTMQPYPPAVNGFTVIGTNIVYGFATITNQPNANGWFSNSIYGNTYKVTQSGNSFFVAIPETTNYTGLAFYATNQASIAAPAGGFAVITNYLGYTPFNLAWFQPATNNPGTNTIAYVSAVSGITNASGVVTNLSVTLTTNTIYYQIR